MAAIQTYHFIWLNEDGYDSPQGTTAGPFIKEAMLQVIGCVTNECKFDNEVSIVGYEDAGTNPDHPNSAIYDMEDFGVLIIAPTRLEMLERLADIVASKSRTSVVYKPDSKLKWMEYTALGEPDEGDTEATPPTNPDQGGKVWANLDEPE